MVKAVLFDWDGTLFDTAEASFRCYERTFASYGIAFDRAAYERTYSPNWHHTYRSVSLPEPLWSEADERWLAHFAGETCSLIDGALAALDALGSRGVARGIVTSGGRERVSRELVEHGLAHHFEHVVCGDDVRERKPHPEALLVALDRMRIAPADAAYVGDSPEDVWMARAAGVYAIAVPGAYPNRAALLASEPDALVQDLAEAVRLCNPSSALRAPSPR